MSEGYNTWKAHHERTKQDPPNVSLVDAVELVASREAALDLGAGALNDARYLAANGFRSVIAVDSEPSIVERRLESEPDALKIVTQRIEDFHFDSEKYDLVNAQYSLPFVAPERVREVLCSIEKTLKPGGIFVGQLFGENDDWNGDVTMNFQTKDDVLAQFRNLEILSLTESETDGETRAGTPKHWHIFTITARKAKKALEDLKREGL